MNKTATIVVGVVAAAAVAYFVVTVIAPPTKSVVPKGTAPQASNAAFISGIINGVTGWISSNRNGASSTAPNNAPLTNIGVPDYATSAYDTNPNYNSTSGDYGPYLPNPNEAAAGEGPLYGPGF